MSFRFENFVALRYLRSKRKEVFISIITVISVLGVAVSVMVLDIVLSIMTGFEAELQKKLIDANAHIVVRRFGGVIENYEELIERILTVKGVTGAFPFTYNQALISTPLGSSGILIRGVTNDPAVKEKFKAMQITGLGFDKLDSHVTLEVERPDGSLNEVSLPAILVGRALSEKLNLLPNTPITLLAPQFSAAPQGVMPKFRRFVTIGYYRSGLSEYESGLAYVAMKDAQAFFGMGNAVSGIEVSVSDVSRAKSISREVERIIGGRDASYFATDWTEPNKALWDALELEKRVYFIVLLLLILIASFSVVSTLVMVVMEKGRDIAVLKSLGASDGMVLRIFLSQGALIGLVGVILGTALGYLGCIGLRAYGFPIDETVFSLKEVPVHIIPANFALVAFSAFVITALAGIYPAVRASRLRPAEAFRYE